MPASLFPCRYVLRDSGQRLIALLAAALLVCLPAVSSCSTRRQVRVRDITDVQGVRENQLIGYGLVVGLRGTGDRQQTYFTIQTLANTLQRLGVQIPPGAAVVKNVAAVFVTAELQPFSEPGVKLDITVSSIGDAKSLEGGVLLLTALHGADGKTYAEAQGPLVLGGYSEGAVGNVRSVNHPTVGRIPEGAIVEREVAIDLQRMQTVSFLLRELDFTAAQDIAREINASFHHTVAEAIDSRRVSIDVRSTGLTSVPELISRVQNLSIAVQPPARVVLNERTGTVVLGGDVLLSPVSVLQGSLTIQVDSVPLVSQPAPLSGGSTVTVPTAQLGVQDKPAQSIRLENGASVEDLMKGLHAIGATAHDIVAILQAIKAAGGMQADLEVI